jgi:hypothetical protein
MTAEKQEKKRKTSLSLLGLKSRQKQKIFKHVHKYIQENKYKKKRTQITFFFIAFFTSLTT